MIIIKCLFNWKTLHSFQMKWIWVRCSIILYFVYIIYMVNTGNGKTLLENRNQSGTRANKVSRIINFKGSFSRWFWICPQKVHPKKIHNFLKESFKLLKKAFYNKNRSISDHPSTIPSKIIRKMYWN